MMLHMSSFVPFQVGFHYFYIYYLDVPISLQENDNWKPSLHQGGNFVWSFLFLSKKIILNEWYVSQK